MPLALLIPLLAPVATELIKWFFKTVINDTVIKEVPAAVIPLISTVVGAVSVELGKLAGVDLGVSPTVGAELGLAGTGVHQVLRQFGVTKPNGG